MEDDITPFTFKKCTVCEREVIPSLSEETDCKNCRLNLDTKSNTQKIIWVDSTKELL